MTDETKYPINAETGLPALPEGYRWYIDKGYDGFGITIQREEDTGSKFVERPRTRWERFIRDYSLKGSYQDVTLVGEERWKQEMSQTILTIPALVERRLTSKMDSDSHFVSDVARILDEQTILENAKDLVERFDRKRQAKASEKYVGAYPPGKLNRD